MNRRCHLICSGDWQRNPASLDVCFKIVPTSGIADWVVRDAGRGAYIEASGDTARSQAVGQETRFGPFSGPGDADTMYATLQQMARANNLVRIAQRAEQNQRAGLHESPVQLNVEAARVDLAETSIDREDLAALLELAAAQDDEGRRARARLREAMTAPSLKSSKPIHRVSQEVIRLVWHNTGKMDVDVTVLYIDAECGIQALFPPAGRQKRLSIGDSEKLELYIKADPVGWEHVIVVATAAQSPPSDLRWLAQPAFDPTASQRRDAPTPLEMIFQEGLFRRPETRGPAVQPDQAAFVVHTWKSIASQGGQPHSAQANARE